MRAVKHAAKPRKAGQRKSTARLLANRVLALDDDELGKFVDALLPRTTEEFRDDLEDLISLEQRKDEKGGRAAKEVFADLKREVRRS